jgi:hypothetical protein
MELGKLGCALGKHKWVKAYVKDNKYNAWECEYCGAKKYHLDLSGDNKTNGDKKK